MSRRIAVIAFVGSIFSLAQCCHRKAFDVIPEAVMDALQPDYDLEFCPGELEEYRLRQLPSRVDKLVEHCFEKCRLQLGSEFEERFHYKDRCIRFRIGVTSKGNGTIEIPTRCGLLALRIYDSHEDEYIFSPHLAHIILTQSSEGDRLEMEIIWRLMSVDDKGDKIRYYKTYSMRFREIAVTRQNNVVWEIIN